MPNAVMPTTRRASSTVEGAKAEAKAWSASKASISPRSPRSGSPIAGTRSRGSGTRATRRWARPTRLSRRGSRYGVKRNISPLRRPELPCHRRSGSDERREVIALKPDGIFLSNGPGDPARRASMPCRFHSDLLKTDIPVFGICLGHQMLALALGAKTEKMHRGHHGANHPVRTTPPARLRSFR